MKNEDNNNIENNNNENKYLNKKLLREKNELDSPKQIKKIKKNDSNISKNNINNNNSNNNNNHYRILEPFRSIGITTSNIPPHIFSISTNRYLLTSNNYSFLLYNLEHLRIERISPPTPNKIMSLSSYKNKIFCSTEDYVYLYDKLHIIKKYKGEKYINKILTFDEVILFSSTEGNLFIYDIYSEELINKLKLNIKNFIHPTTYVNKILYSSNNNNMDLILYNINTEKEIYNFNNIFNNNNSKITLIEQSPVIDVVCVIIDNSNSNNIINNNNEIVLVNLKLAKKLFSLTSSEKILSISFSNDSTLNFSLLATCTKNNVYFWDLNKKSIHYVLKEKNCENCVFLKNEPIFILLSEEENFIKMFKIDKETGLISILRERKGQKNYPIKIRFYGESRNNENTEILSIDNTSIRLNNIISEKNSKTCEILTNDNNINNNLIDFDFSYYRQRDWDNLSLFTNKSEIPILFSMDNFNKSKINPKLIVKNSLITCLTVSICGNFCFVGFENSKIEKFNMQSGKSRWIIENAHKGCKINSLKSDNINSLLISISEKDLNINFWDIFSKNLIDSIKVDFFPKNMEINREYDLIAVSFENNNIEIYDKQQIKKVRNLIIHENNNNNNEYDINDFIFSKDANWLIILTNSDKSLRIFDILSTNIIEYVTFEKIPISVDISLDNQYIALSFKDLKGIYLYINRLLFVDYDDVVNVDKPIKMNIMNFNINEIKTRKDYYYYNNNDNIENEKFNINEIIKNNNEKIVENENNKNLIKFSNENNIKYKIINNIEILQEKNKLINQEDKKKENKTPFFLFNLDDLLQGKFPENNNKKNSLKNNNNNNNNKNEEYLNLLKNYTHFKNEKIINNSRINNINNFDNIKDNNDNNNLDENIQNSKFILQKILDLYKNNKIKSIEITNFLNKLNPNVVDLEIRSIDPFIITNNKNYLKFFSDYLLDEFKETNNYEILNAYLNRFLKIYNEEIINDNEIKENLNKINELNINKYEKLEELYNNTMCLISYFGKIQI